MMTDSKAVYEAARDRLADAALTLTPEDIRQLELVDRGIDVIAIQNRASLAALGPTPTVTVKAPDPGHLRSRTTSARRRRHSPNGPSRDVLCK